MKIVITTLLALLFTTSIWAQVISDPLKIQMKDKSQHEVIIQFVGQKDFDTSDKNMTKLEKAQYVFEGLQQQATKNQQAAINFLKENNLKYKSFYINNIIHTKLSTDQISEISTMAFVKRIFLNPVFKNELGTIDQSPSDIEFRSEYTWGLQDLQVPEIWDAGFRGEGVVIGGQDTGYDWFHPAIKGSYRGSENNHDYSWHDAIQEPLQGNGNSCGYALEIPCDDNGHGTHTAGTFAGQEVSDQPIFGIAPLAKWIGCRNMDEGYGTPVSYSDCLEWFLAPTDINGTNPMVEMAPDIINNSWACTEGEGCTSDMKDILRYAAENLRNSGILVVVSAGNEGRQGCSSVVNPLAIYESSFSVGAYSENQFLAGFSSIGPVTVDSSNRMKPDIVAPGVRVLSAYRDTSYRELNGTSMAGPHIAGLAALILSANPSLKGNVDSLERLIELNAVPILVDTFCQVDSTYPNNMYGYGKPLGADIISEITVSVNSQPKQSLLVYPNPSEGFITFELPEYRKKAQLRIYNMAGVLMHKVSIDSGVKRYALLLDKFDNGLYLYLLQSDQTYSGKIVISH